MNATEKLKFARQRYSAAVKALNAVRDKKMIGLGKPRMVNFFGKQVAVYEQKIDLNAAERTRLCRRANRLNRIVYIIAARHNLSLAI
jgi:hypothetical protein